MVNLEELGMRDYVVLIDQSGSMAESVGKSGVTRWKAVEEYAVAVARECEKLDADGIVVYTFNKNFSRYESVTADKVADIFHSSSPMGGTDFVPVLTDVFNRHFAGKKPSTVIIFTDGEPSDGAVGQKAVASLLVNTANKLESDSELGITFIQVGDDRGAKDFLKKLDDDLQGAGAKFDIVDAKTCDDLETMSVQDVLLAAVND